MTSCQCSKNIAGQVRFGVVRCRHQIWRIPWLLGQQFQVYCPEQLPKLQCIFALVSKELLIRSWTAECQGCISTCDGFPEYSCWFSKVLNFCIHDFCTLGLVSLMHAKRCFAGKPCGECLDRQDFGIMTWKHLALKCRRHAGLTSSQQVRASRASQKRGSINTHTRKFQEDDATTQSLLKPVNRIKFIGTILFLDDVNLCPWPSNPSHPETEKQGPLMGNCSIVGYSYLLERNCRQGILVILGLLVSTTEEAIHSSSGTVC